MSGYEAYRLIKDGRGWDYTTDARDIAAWMEKIWREEPDAVLWVESATRAEMYKWKTGEDADG